MSSSGLNTGDFSNLEVAYDLGVGSNRNSGVSGQVLMSGGRNKAMTWGSTGVSEIYAGDGIIVTSSTNPAGDKEKTIKAHIDEDTIDFATGSPTRLMEVKKVPNSLSFGAGISASPNQAYDGSTAITITGTTGDHVAVSRVGEGSYPTTFTSPLTNVGPTNTTGMTGIAGLGIESLTAVATAYEIDLNFNLTREAGDTTPGISAESWVRLDRSASLTNQGWTTTNGVSGPIKFSAGSATQVILDRYYRGRLSFKWIVTGLTIGSSYNFIPRWTSYASNTSNTQALQIQYGGSFGALTIVANPVQVNTPTGMAEQGGGGGGV